MTEQMQIKQLEPEIENSDIWKDDKLNCKDFAERLTTLLQGQTEPLSIALNGAWGSGKTFLLKRWCEDLKKQGRTAIYFNAWEDDHLDDPLVAIIGQLWMELRGNTPEEVWAGMKKACLPLIKGIALTTLKTWIQLSKGIVLPDDFESILKTASEATYDDYRLLTEARNDLRRRLQELADNVYNKGNVNSSDNSSSEKTAKSGSKKDKYPLVFIIDELDRCRPTFAISVLERIKHLFNIKHIVFVFGIDRKQLGKSIQSVYGDIDIDNYLHRFFDLDMNIQVIQQEQYIDALWERYKIRKILSERAQEEKSDLKLTESNTFRQMFISISKYHHLSLREIEQCLMVFAMVQNSISKWHYIWPEMFVILLLMKLRFQGLYSDFINGRIRPNEISDKLFPPDYNREHSDFCFLEIALYASYVCEYPNTQEENPVLSLLEDARNGNILKNKLASERLKKMNTNELKFFADRVTERSSSMRDNVSYFNTETVKRLHNLVDMISM